MNQNSASSLLLQATKAQFKSVSRESNCTSFEYFSSFLRFSQPKSVQLLTGDCVCPVQLVHWHQQKHPTPAGNQLSYFTGHCSQRDAFININFTSFSSVSRDSVVFGLFMYRTAVICPWIASFLRSLYCRVSNSFFKSAAATRGV